MSIVVTNNAEALNAGRALVAASASASGEGVAQSAPGHKPVQNEAPESDTGATEEVEAQDDGSEDASGAEEQSDEPGKSDDSEKAKPKSKGGFQRRIDKLNAAKAEAQREAEYWKREALKTATAPKPEAESVGPQRPAAADGEPNPDDFEDYKTYSKALARWEVRQELKERDQKAEQSRMQVEQDKALKSHRDRVTAFAKKTPDYQEALEGVEDILISPALESQLVTSEKGPELIYELAKNREEFERIAALPPMAAARELGRIEARLDSKSSESKPEPKRTTNAPKPPDPVGAKGGAVAKSIYDPKLSQREYEAVRREQLKARGAF